MFEALEQADDDPQGSFTFDGAAIRTRPGMTVAAALLAAGYTTFRPAGSTKAPRGPYCMMGACYGCLVIIDGITVQACMVPARPGLTVTRTPSTTGRTDS